MNISLIFAQSPPPSPVGGPWGFVVLVLLILFVTLIVTEGSKNNDK